MPKHIDMMRRREESIFNLLQFISRGTQDFTAPKLITIGGYALRAYVPFSRYTRDCDFILRKEAGWKIEKLKKILSAKIDVETIEKRKSYGYLRMISFIEAGRDKVKISIDFLEGEIRGRTVEQIVLIDESFIEKSHKNTISIAGNDIEIFVPDYMDYFITKVVSARSSDVRDIAALVWYNGIPENIDKRSGKLLPIPGILKKNLKEKIIPDISDRRFLNSWRGTFITSEFTEDIKRDVVKKLTKLVSS